MTITIEALEAKRDELSTLIDSFKKQCAFAAAFPIKITAPVLEQGEKWAGAIIPPEGRPYHLILMPGELDSSDWHDAMAWAARDGGDLPGQVEAAMLHTHLRGEFQEAWYWTNTTLRHDDTYAFFQSFLIGTQNFIHKGDLCRARRVRRLVLE